MKRITILLLLCLMCIPVVGCGGLNTRVLTGGVNGVGSVAVIGPIIIGAFGGKMYAGIVEADLESGEGLLVTDKHGFAGAAGIGTIGGVDANGDANAQMDRDFSADIYQAEEAKSTTDE